MTPTLLTARDYLDPGLHALERARVLAPAWQFLGAASALESTGAFLAETLAGYPVLAVRSETGLHGFHNVCRHRAGPLVTAAQGQCGPALVCRYHGWAYTLDGRLKSARDFGAAPGFDARSLGLLPIDIAVWNGFVFAAVRPPETDLDTALAPVTRRLGGRDLSGLVFAGQRTHRIACNWKLYVENYLEGYHVPVVHPGLDAEIDSAAYQVTMDGAVCIHAAPPRQAGTVYQGLWAWIAPHLGLNVYADGLMWERILSDGPRVTRLVYDYYLTPEAAADPAARARILAMSDSVTAEDAGICEAVQANLDAGAYQAGVLSPRHEAGIAWFQDYVVNRRGTTTQP